MCPPGYHHNGIMAARELGHTMYGYICINDAKMSLNETLCHFNMGLINKVDMVCLSPVGYGV